MREDCAMSVQPSSEVVYLRGRLIRFLCADIRTVVSACQSPMRSACMTGPRSAPRSSSEGHNSLREQGCFPLLSLQVCLHSGAYRRIEVVRSDTFNKPGSFEHFLQGVMSLAMTSTIPFCASSRWRYRVPPTRSRRCRPCLRHRSTPGRRASEPRRPVRAPG